MRILAFVIYLAMLGRVALAQNSKETHYWKSFNYDTAAYNDKKDLLKGIALPDLITTDGYHFRFWLRKHGQCVVDISTNDFVSFIGLFKVYVEGKPQNNRKYQIFYDDYKLREDTAKTIYQLLSELNRFPDADSIPKWRSIIFNDGYSEELEFSTPVSYTTKSWDNAEYRDSISLYAVDIDCITEKVYFLLNWEGRWEGLLNRVPPGSYSLGGVQMTHIAKSILWRKFMRRFKWIF